MASDTGKPGFPFMMGNAQQVADEWSKMLSAMKLPAAPNMDALLAVQKRNMDALSAANRIAVEGAQTVAKRHMEIMQQTLAELSETMRTLSATEAPGAKAATQAEMLKQAYERGVANTKEMSDLIQRANDEAIGQLNQRFTEAVDEMKALMGKA
ncbi:MAG: TIGR01841 family phasin [Alphaproteobacteria bacterium]|nr:TIGR01841 family phasin [Alphaproteobacteria bacterium]